LEERDLNARMKFIITCTYMIGCTYVGFKVGGFAWESIVVAWKTRRRHIVNIMLKPVVIYEENVFNFKLLAVLNLYH
jgi:hypothetical protein